MRLSSLYFVLLLMASTFFGSAVSAQSCVTHPESPPFARLAQVQSGGGVVELFGCGNYPPVTNTPAGTYTFSGTLQPGNYILQAGAVAATITAGCDEIVSEHLVMTLGSGVNVVSGVRESSVYTDPTGPISDITGFAGNYNFSASVGSPNGCGAFMPPASDYSELTWGVRGVGPLTAQTKWTLDCYARGQSWSCGTGNSQMEFQDNFIVSSPTSYTITCTVTQDVGFQSAPSAGSSQAIPVLPSGTIGPGWLISAQSGDWVDPPLTFGYSFSMVNGNHFTKILNFPDGIDGDGQFVVQSGGVTIGSFSVGQQVDFVALTGSPIATFEVLGITPLLNESNPAAFPIRLEYATPAGRFVMTPIDALPPVPYCFGNGSTTACPCGNAGANGNGCASSINPAGARLSSSGFSSTGADSFVLRTTGTADSSVLYFQGTSQIAVTFGDGLRCAGGTVVRIGPAVASGGASHYPGAGGTPISAKGAIPSGGGVTRNYQAWYRNAANFCTPSTFNLTNGLSVTWGI